MWRCWCKSGEPHRHDLSIYSSELTALLARIAFMARHKVVMEIPPREIKRADCVPSAEVGDKRALS